MKRAIVIVAIQLVVVGLVLALTLGTLSWYMGNNDAKSATPTYVTASDGSHVQIIDDQNLEGDPYMGQTGRGYTGDPYNGVDAPYKVQKKVTILTDPNSDNYAVHIAITAISIETTLNVVYSSESDEKVIPSFTWRLHYIDSTTGAELGYYKPDANGFATLVRGNGTVGDYLHVTKETKIVYMVFDFYYLDEASLACWENADYQTIKAFNYSGYDFMRAVFTMNFVIGIDIPNL